MSAIVAASSSKSRKRKPELPAPIESPLEKRARPVGLPKSMSDFLRTHSSIKGSDIDAFVPSGVASRDLHQFLRLHNVVYDVYHPNFSNFERLCQIFLGSFVLSDRGVLLVYEHEEYTHVNHLGQFPVIMAAIRNPNSKLSQILFYPTFPLDSERPQINVQVQTITNRMIQTTVQNKLEINLFWLLKHSQQWAWWNHLYPTDLIFILGKLLITEENLTTPEHQTTFLQHVYNSHHPSELQDIVSVDFLVAEEALSYQLIIDSSSLPLDDDRDMSTVPMARVMYQYLPNGHVEFEEISILAKPKNAMRILIPRGMALWLLYYQTIPMTGQWHNLLRAYLSVIAGKKSIEKQNEDIQKVGKDWYQRISSRQDIFLQILKLSATQLGAIFDRSFKLALNLATHFIHGHDWLVSFWETLGPDWIWPTVDPKVVPSQYLTTLLTPERLRDMWIRSVERQTLTNYNHSNVTQYAWDLVYQPELKELRLLNGPTLWWNKAYPEQEIVYAQNGCQVRSLEMHPMEKQNYLKTQKRIINSQQYALQLNKWGEMQSFHSYIISHMEKSTATCDWLKPVIRALFGKHKLQINKSFTNRAAAQILNYVGERHKTFHSMYLDNPETLPVNMVSSLLYIIIKNFLHSDHGTIETDEYFMDIMSNSYSSHYPGIPGNSITFDAWSYLISNDHFDDNDRVKPDTVLLVLRSGAWLVVELNTLILITFAARVLYASGSLVANGLATDTTLSYSEFSRYLGQSCFLFKTITFV